MKFNYKSIIFAVVFGSVFNSNTVTANVNNDSTKNQAAYATIANGAQKNFETFVNQSLPSFVKQEDWKKVVEVVTLYNESPSKLTNINTNDRLAFEKAASNLANQLNTNGTFEARMWLKNLNNTVRTVKFIWNNDFNIEEPAIESNIINTI